MSDAELIERLPQEVEELRRANAELGCENAQLQRRLAQAMKQNEQWRRGHRKRSRRRCSRPERSRRPSMGRARGGQTGHRGSNCPVPDPIDRTVDHPLPARCDGGGDGGLQRLVRCLRPPRRLAACVLRRAQYPRSQEDRGG